MRNGILVLALVLALAACVRQPQGTSFTCDEPNEHQKPGWPWHDEEHLAWLGLPGVVAPEPIATAERLVEYMSCQ